VTRISITTLNIFSIPSRTHWVIKFSVRMNVLEDIILIGNGFVLNVHLIVGLVVVPSLENAPVVMTSMFSIMGYASAAVLPAGTLLLMGERAFKTPPIQISSR
jgi:hypothetical protein